ncbi:MAG: hypothetical protein HUU10_07030 [Bacteroidetes bacterium]|nr:hypothetical protein [Bacteroidota bacterium]
MHRLQEWIFFSLKPYRSVRYLPGIGIVDAIRYLSCHATTRPVSLAVLGH